MIYGNFGYGNLGNEATLAATLQMLNEFMPGARVTVAGSVPANAEITHGVPCIPIRPQPRKGDGLSGPLRKLVREIDRFAQIRDVLAGADCLLMPGTGIFDDFNSPTIERAYPLWQWCRTARRCGVSVRFVSSGAGPVERRLSRFFFRLAAMTADDRSFRDEDSRDYVRRVLKVDTSRDRITPDLVFGLKLDTACPPPHPGPPRVVAIGAMVYHTWRGKQGGPDDVYAAYLDKMTRFCLDLMDKGAELRFVTSDPGDRPAKEALLARLHAARPALAAAATAPAVTTFADICREIGQTDAVVASRFHTIVAALMMGRPTVSLGYSPKNREVMKLFGLETYCQDIQKFDAGLLHRHFIEATTDPAATHLRLSQIAARLKCEVRETLARVAEDIAALPVRARRSVRITAPASPQADAVQGRVQQ